MTSPDNRPNIVFFFTDDQRFDTVAAVGDPQVRTPNLDRLVARGTWFDRAYIMGGSSGAVCMPSRAMLHTGRTLYHLDRQGQAIPADHALLGETLRDAGYRTWGAGKWHNGTDSYARSFTDGAHIFFGGMNDHWNVPACDFRPDGDYPDPRPLHARFGDLFRKLNLPYDHIATGRHSTDLFADAACDWLGGYDDDTPYFMYLSFMAPHDPREMPARFLNLYDPDKIDLPPNFLPEHPFDNGALKIRDEKLAGFPRTEAEVRKHLAEYYAMISHLDDAVGRVLEAVEARGELDNTIVVFAGDNGLAVGQHGLFGKQSNYEHSIHVPLLFAGPGIAPGRRADAMCYLLDLFPTLCDLAGIETPDTVEGRSLAAAIGADSDAADSAGREHLIFAYTHTHRAIRNERFKLIEYAVDGRRHTQLFDLALDRWETTNLADQSEHAPTVDRLRSTLRDGWAALDDDQPGQGAEFWPAFDR